MNKDYTFRTELLCDAAVRQAEKVPPGNEYVSPYKAWHLQEGNGGSRIFCGSNRIFSGSTSAQLGPEKIPFGASLNLFSGNRPEEWEVVQSNVSRFGAASVSIANEEDIEGDSDLEVSEETVYRCLFNVGVYT